MAGVDRLNPRRWQRTRRAVLERDGWRCVKCGRAGRLEVDHIQPIAAGGPKWDFRNLQALCVDCHIAKSRSEQESVGMELQRWRDYLRDSVL